MQQHKNATSERFGKCQVCEKRWQSVCVCLILIIHSYMFVAHMPPKYHGVYNVIIIWSPTLGKGLMIWFDWTISKSNEWVTCILRSSNVHSKSFKIIQSVSETFWHGWFHYQLSPKRGVSWCFPVLFPMDSSTTPRHPGGFRCQVSTQTVWPKIVRPSTHLHTTSAGDAAISVAEGFSQ